MKSSNKMQNCLAAVAISALSMTAQQLGAANLTASSTLPAVFFNDSDAAGIEWQFLGGVEGFELQNRMNLTSPLDFAPDARMGISLTPDYLILRGETGAHIANIHKSAPANSLNILSDGDVSLAGGGLFVESNTSRVGIGTSFPGFDLHIKSTLPVVYFDDTSQNSTDWYVGNNNNDFVFVTGLNGTGGPVLSNVLTLDAPTGYVGVGTNAPTAKLNVAGSAGTRLLVQNNDAGAPGEQVMFQLESASSGKVRFAITGAGNNTWTFDNNPGTNTFSISKVGTRVNEFRVKSNGDGIFQRNSYAVEHINTSSRAAKTDFADIDVQRLLAQVAALPLSQWRYRKEAPGARHVGPVAEDFQRAFGLGDGKTISTVDASGVAIAAIQGLHAMLQDKEARITVLEAELAKVEQQQDQRILQLEKALAGL